MKRPGLQHSGFSRRRFLAGLGAATLAPFVPLLNVSGQEAGAPKRLILFYTPHGTVKKQWTPTGTETKFTLPRLLAPLQKHQAKINVLSGINMQDVGVGAPHTKGLPLCWTGSKLLDDSTFNRADGSGGATYGWNASASVDQVVAHVIGQQTAYRSLEFGVRCGGSNPGCRMVYADARQPLAPAIDPWSQFVRLFSPASAQQTQERLSSLQLVRAQLASLSPRIATEERAKIDAHVASISDLQTRLQLRLKTCAGPTLQTKVAPTDVANTPVVMNAQIALVAAALQCDLTRVVSLQYSIGDADNQPYPWLNINDSHHSLTHAPDTDTASWEKVMQIRVWYAQQFARLLDTLDSIPEGNGTLLDNCLVVWGSELGTGNTHSFKSTPFITAGGAGGAVRTGRYLEYNEQVNHNRLLVAMCQAMGLADVQTFGTIDDGTGPLARLLA